jgi:hypothetical protein
LTNAKSSPSLDATDLRLLELLQRDPSESTKVHDAARSFRHIGLHVVSEIPVAEKNEFAAIMTMSRKIQRLTGESLHMVDWEAGHAGAA